MSDGGPAFPCTEPSRIEVSPGGAQTREWPINLGMSLRDYFAAMAMQMLTDEVDNEEYLAMAAYKIADAMLKERDSD